MECKTVLQFPVPVDDVVRIEMPSGAELLHFAEKRGQWFLWALINPDAPNQTRTFRLVGTGHPIDWSPAMEFVGSCLGHGGALVFHLFEIKPSPESNGNS